MKKITLLLTLVFSLNAFSQRTAMNYLIQLGGGNGSTWTKTLNANDSIVDLTVAGQSLTAWLANRASWASGDQIWIAAGTYSFTSSYNIGSNPSLSGSYPSAIYGGFSGTENSLSDRVKGTNAWDYTNETILNGASSSNGVFGAGSDRNLTIDGLTFTACVNTAGQAVYQRPGTSVQNCKFTNNACVCLRYYISAASKTASVSNCYFQGNVNTVSGGAEGGCIMINNASAGGTYNATGCIFDSNSCSASGSGASAGIKAQGVGTTNIASCIFKNNNATAGNSSAASLTSPTASLINALVYGTSEATNKTAIYVTGGSITNCTVVNNLGGSIYLNNTTSSTAINLTNSVFWGTDSKSGQIATQSSCVGNITNCAYTSLSTNYTGTVTNSVDIATSTTGLFTDPDLNLWNLASGSVLIDMGTDTNAPLTDLNGTPRPQGSGYDIGAYEYIMSATNKLYSDKQLFGTTNNGLIALTSGMAIIYDLSGQVCLEKQVQTGEILKLKKGIYLVKLITPNAKNIQKIIL